MKGAAPVLLGTVQRHVGVAQQGVGLRAVAGRKRNPDAGTHNHVIALDLVGPAERVDQPARQIRRLSRFFYRRLHYGKFITAEPRHHIALAQARGEPSSHRLEQEIADRMAERVVDMLEVVEVDAQDRKAFAAPDMHERRVKPLMEQQAVGQVRQPVVMRHVGDACFRLLALGDVDDCRQNGRPLLEHQRLRIGQHFDRLAVTLDVSPGLVGVIGASDRRQGLPQPIPVVPWPQVKQRHAQELIAAITVMRNRRIIDGDEFQALGIVQPHWHRVAVEQQAK
jgi:hypothetical protein